MGKLKDKAVKTAKTNEKKFTLTQNEVNVLMGYRSIAQNQLDQMLQLMTSLNLHNIAIERFGYSAEDNLEFKLDLDNPQDNITITSI